MKHLLLSGSVARRACPVPAALPVVMPRVMPTVRAFAAAVLLGGAQAAWAQGFDSVRLFGAAPGKDGGTAGVALISGARYAGSDERRVMLLPTLDYQWANGFFAGVGNGVGYNFSTQPGLSYGVRLTADFGRKESRSNALRGMGDIDASAQLGAFFNYSLTRSVSLTSSLRYGSGNDNKGLLLDLGLGTGRMLAPQWRVGANVGATLANAQYQQSYFGVSRTQAARSGYRTYTPGAGVRDMRVGVSLTHIINPRLTMTGGLSVSSLLGDAKDSPLTKQATTVNGLVVLGYGF